MEIRQANMIIAKAGGNASKNAYNCKVSIPKVWADQMGVTSDARTLTLSFDGECIMIKKSDS